MGVVVSFFSAVFGKLIGQQNEQTRNKFEIQDGITLFDNDQSPCARRVRITLHEKNIPYHKVSVDLLKGENHYPDYVEISPNRKIPALAFKNVKGIPDQIMFESSVIIEYLDTKFPTPQLYPTDPWEKAQAKMWMDWELGLVDDHVPIVYQNVLSFIMRLIYKSKQAYLDSVHPNMPKAKVQIFCNSLDGKLRSNEELEKHALASYQNLIVLEKALEGKDFLVGGRFTVADLTVLPRVQMFLQVGLYFSEKHFPNIVRYLNNLQGRPSFEASERFSTRLMKSVMIRAPWFIVTVSNWKCGTNHTRFEGSRLIDKALGESTAVSRTPLIQSCLPCVHENDVTVFDYPMSTDTWQIKILLGEKGVPYKTVECPFIDVIGRAAGSGSVVKAQHGGRMIAGPRTLLEYLDETFKGSKLIPSDPESKAKVQLWQAWEQAMYINELAALVETFIVSKALVLRYKDHLDDLLSLRSNPAYQAKFDTILKCFMAGLEKESPLWPLLKADYSQLVLTDADKKKKKELGHELLHIRLKYLEESLQDQTYLVGNNVTLADICVFCRLALFAHVDMKISAQKYPSVATWMLSLQGRKPFAQCIDVLEKILSI